MNEDDLPEGEDDDIDEDDVKVQGCAVMKMTRNLFYECKVLDDSNFDSWVTSQKVSHTPSEHRGHHGHSI